MFTGIIQQMGIVTALEGGATKRLTLRTPIAEQLRLGDSIAVNGTCLTAVALGSDSFSADLLQETLERTTLGCLVPGMHVNLELPTPAGAPLGGHIVQGHVEGIGVVSSIGRESEGAETWRMRIDLPEPLRRDTTEKGSIAIDGISLTVAKITSAGVEVAIIPHTYAETNVHSWQIGERVNLETDALAKYARRERGNAGITLARLVSSGY